MKSTSFCSVTIVVVFLMPTVSQGEEFPIAFDWVKEVTGLDEPALAVSFNLHTEHFLISEISGNNVLIADATGNLTGEKLSKEGLPGDSFIGLTDIGALESGVLFGGCDPAGDGTVGLVRWENETALPSAFMPIDGMVFPRTLSLLEQQDCILMAVAGNNDGCMSILSSTDEIEFSLFDEIIPSSPDFYTKQGIVWGGADDRLYGTRADGAGEVSCHVRKPDGEWEPLESFHPPISYASPPDGLGAAALIGYSETANAVFVVGYSETNDYLTVLDGTTGANLYQTQIGADIGVFGYGEVCVDDARSVAHFGGRSNTLPNVILGKFTFSGLLEPTSTPLTETPTTTPTWTPSQTPTDTPVNETPSVTPSFTPTTSPVATNTPSSATRIPDYDGDDHVGCSDVLIFLRAFNTTGEDAALIDLDNDQDVDFRDLFLFALWWSQNVANPPYTMLR